RGSNERHPAANHVDGNHVEALPLIRRKLAKIRAKKIGKRTRGIDAFVPTGEGRAFRAFYDRGADDGDGQVAAPARKDGFAETFRERVSIGHAEMLRATQANTH